MNEMTLACRHLGTFFKASVTFNLEPIEFILKALNSEYKEGLEDFRPQWFSQSPYYYLEEFLETNKIKSFIYHTVDPLYVLEDSIEINNINLDFEKILK